MIWAGKPLCVYGPLRIQRSICLDALHMSGCGLGGAKEHCKHGAHPYVTFLHSLTASTGWRWRFMLKEAVRLLSKGWQCRHSCTNATRSGSLMPQVCCVAPLSVAQPIHAKHALPGWQAARPLLQPLGLPWLLLNRRVSFLFFKKLPVQGFGFLSRQSQLVISPTTSHASPADMNASLVAQLPGDLHPLWSAADTSARAGAAGSSAGARALVCDHVTLCVLLCGAQSSRLS